MSWFRKNKPTVTLDAKGLGTIVRFEDGLYGVRAYMGGKRECFLDVAIAPNPDFWWEVGGGDKWVTYGRADAAMVQRAIDNTAKHRSVRADKGTPV